MLVVLVALMSTFKMANAIPNAMFQLATTIREHVAVSLNAY